METLRRILAILLADLRERARATRFWVALLLVGVVSWLCFPAIDSGHLAIDVDGARGRYSSAWIGLSLGLAYATLLAWLGFYLVRGTVLRDFDTRVWQLLVATPMTRAGYLVAKWASHMAVFTLVMAVGLVVGAVAQLVRGEDRAFDLIELIKPILVLTLPALSLTAFFAILFDMLPSLRRTGGNVAYFFLWLFLFAALSIAFQQGPSTPTAAASNAMSDPAGLSLAQQALRESLAVTAPTLDTSKLSVGWGEVEGRPQLFPWTGWHVQGAALLGRLFWLVLGLLASAALAPFLDRAAAHVTAERPVAAVGRRLRWLDRILRPLEYGALGTLVAAELRLALRPRGLPWWGVTLVAGVVQLAAPMPVAAGAAIVSLMLGVDVHARTLLREAETRTDGLVFTAPNAVRRLLLARSVSAVLLALAAVAPLMLRALPTSDGLSGALVLVAAAFALVGLASGALFRSPRPYELAMVFLAYVGLQGAGPLAVASLSPAMSAGIGGALAASAMLLLAWPRLASVGSGKRAAA